MPISTRGTKKGAKSKASKSKAAKDMARNSPQDSPVSVDDLQLDSVEFEPPALDSLELLARDVAGMLPDKAIVVGGGSVEKPARVSESTNGVWLDAMLPQLLTPQSCFSTTIERPTANKKTTTTPSPPAEATAAPPMKASLKFGRYLHCDLCSFYHAPTNSVCPRCGT